MEENANKLAGIADANLGLLEDAPPSEKPSETVETQAPGKGPDGRGETTPDVNSVLEELRGRIERGEMKVEDLPQELLPADARKVQSSFARREARIEKGVTRAAETLKAAGVTLPEGKSVMDLITEGSGEGFAKLLEGAVNQAVAPLKRNIDAGELEKAIDSNLSTTIRDHPDLQPLLPEIGKVIESTPRFGEYIARDPSSVQDLVLAVGRDLQLQRERIDHSKTKAERDRFKKILTDANIAITNGTSTSRGGSKAPSQATDGSDKKPKGFDAIASAVYDRIAAQNRAN